MTAGMWARLFASREAALGAITLGASSDPAARKRILLINAAVDGMDAADGHARCPQDALTAPVRVRRPRRGGQLGGSLPGGTTGRRRGLTAASGRPASRPAGCAGRRSRRGHLRDHHRHHHWSWAMRESAPKTGPAPPAGRGTQAAVGGSRLIVRFGCDRCQWQNCLYMLGFCHGPHCRPTRDRGHPGLRARVRLRAGRGLRGLRHRPLVPRRAQLPVARLRRDSRAPSPPAAGSPSTSSTASKRWTRRAP